MYRIPLACIQHDDNDVILPVCRPKLTCYRFPALRSIVVCFLEAVPLLMSVVGMLFFFLFIFGVTGTELFAGDYHWVSQDSCGSGADMTRMAAAAQ